MTRPHILLVEDDASARMTLAIGLRGAGYRVTEAADGKIAIDLLEQETFTLVLTDLVLGEVSGIEVLYTARMQPYCPLVILLTGHGSLDSALAAFRNGAYDYVLKPCAPDHLLHVVAGAVRRHTLEGQMRESVRFMYGQLHEVLGCLKSATSATPAGPLQIGGLRIGATRRDVTFHGQPVTLTPIEYALLRCLAETPGQTRTYREIVRQTHQTDLSESEAQTLIRPHVHHLRTKLATDYLVTERGIGYRLVDGEAGTA
jgi:DNA-binding response OmpR family regulator